MRRRAARHDRDRVWLSRFSWKRLGDNQAPGRFSCLAQNEREELFGWNALPPMRRTHAQVTHAGLPGEACQSTNLAQDLSLPGMRLARLAPKGRFIEQPSYATDNHQRVGYPPDNNVARAVCDRKAQPSRAECGFRTTAIAVRLMHPHVFNPHVDQTLR